MATEWQVGDKIQNRWEIHKILGGPDKSGMGIVYVVYDVQFGSAYAAKTFQEEAFARASQTADRFVQEAQVWISLDIHENVTQAHFVEVVYGKPLLFLEYVSGGDLSGWVGTPRLTKDSPQVLRFAIQFCDGMIHALSKGIKAHRDIKPQNCLITENGTLKVTDFGLAKIFAEANPSVRADDGVGDGRKRPERPGAIASQTMIGSGTPPYMAPEQFHEHVDIRADVYSFGVMLFQMLTGRLPFLARSRGPIQEIIQEFERLHEVAPVPRLEGQLSIMNPVVQTCLAKRPEQRFADFREVREELADLYQKLTGKAPPQPTVGPSLNAGQWVNKGSSLGYLGRSEEALACYDRALEADPGCMAAWFNKGNSLQKLGRQQEALACYERVSEFDPSLVARVWVEKGGALAALGRREEALACCNRAVEINHLGWIGWLNLGKTLEDLGQREKALACYDRGLALNPRDEKAWSNKGNVLVELGRPEEAVKCCDVALHINPRYEFAWVNKGFALAKCRRFNEALACFDSALEANSRHGPAWFDKGATLAGLGRWSEALACLEQAQHLQVPQATQMIQKVRQAMSGTGVPKAEAGGGAADANARSGSLLGRLFGKREGSKEREAQDWYEKALASVKSGRNDEALEYHNRAVALNPHFKEAWMARGLLLATMGRMREALTALEEARRLGEPLAAQMIQAVQLGLLGPSGPTGPAARR